jgi:hypothetical protein
VAGGDADGVEFVAEVVEVGANAVRDGVVAEDGDG